MSYSFGKISTLRGTIKGTQEEGLYVKRFKKIQRFAFFYLIFQDAFRVTFELANYNFIAASAIDKS